VEVGGGQQPELLPHLRLIEDFSKNDHTRGCSAILCHTSLPLHSW
jgi:hypothetical protein